MRQIDGQVLEGGRWQKLYALFLEHPIPFSGLFQCVQMDVDSFPNVVQSFLNCVAAANSAEFDAARCVQVSLLPNLQRQTNFTLNLTGHESPPVMATDVEYYPRHCLCVQGILYWRYTYGQ